MTDQSLDKLLRGLQVPPPDDGARGKALDRALIALQHRGMPRSEPVASQLWKRWLWSAGAVACALIVFLVAARSDKTNFAAQRSLLQQLELEFPGQLGAVIERGDDISLIIAERGAAAPSDQPLVVTFRKLGRTIRVVSYSGREVCLSMDGRRLCFEMLLTDEGKVIVAGRDFLWSDQHRHRVAGYRVQAAPLRPS